MDTKKPISMPPPVRNVIQEFDSLLKTMLYKQASDLFITVGRPPTMKIRGEIQSVTDESITPKQVHQLAYHLMNEQQQQAFQENLECNFAIAPDNIGRFRVNVFQQKNNMGIVLRRIETQIPTIKGLRIPKILEKIAMLKRGLVIIVGATGTGKSSTLAAMLGHRNKTSSGHIVTVEDPIEFIHEHDGCIVTQREVGVDTRSFEAALQNTLRQAPDVILIGEVRSRETMEHAIAFAETGHLCLTTLHANNANQALDRIANFFPEDRGRQLFLDLSLNLKAIIAQQLISTPDRKERRCVVEIMLNTPLIAKLIHTGKWQNLKEVMAKSNPQGMNTFDQALYGLYEAKQISYEDALRHADSENELRLMIKLGNKSNPDKLAASLDGITLMDIQP